jgi:hypothetical protein
MERYMYQDDFFENNLKRKADEYRMYPSDKSWNLIQSRLNNHNKFNWKAVAVLAVLISISVSLSDESGTNFTKPTITKTTVQTENRIVNAERPAVIYNRRKTQILIQPGVTAPANPPEKETVVADNISDGSNIVVADETAFSYEIQPITEKISTINTSHVPVLTIRGKATSNNLVAVGSHAAETAAQIEKEAASLQTEGDDTRIADLTPKPVFKPLTEQTGITAANTKEAITETNPSQQSDAQLNYEVKVPVLVKRKPSKLLQYYITPSSSYRVLVSENRYWLGNLPLQDVENVVNHKSSLGAEAGAATLVPITKNVRFKAGLQFNYTKYTVEAYTKIPEYTSIQVNNTNIVRRTSLANNSGYRITEVANKTLQLALPVGIEVTMAGSSRFQWNIAGTIQPAYLIKASGYLITDDYKSYIKAPDLLSNMNLNTAFETFFRWNAGKFDVQAGPQIRYQLFSNTEKGYPVREHLVDYGFKIGIIKALR